MLQPQNGERFSLAGVGGGPENHMYTIMRVVGACSLGKYAIGVS